MIIQCQGCAARYFLPEERVPHDPIRVRCPKCRAVFTLEPRREPVAAPGGGAGEPAAVDARAAAAAMPPLETPAGPAVGTPTEGAAASAPPEPPVVDTSAPEAAAATHAPDAAATPTAPGTPDSAEPTPAGTDAPAAAPETSGAGAKPARRARGGRSPEDRAKRLARVLVSDILCYNRETRDEALRNGNLMEALGEEIRKSWELYKEKVGPELASSTNYFKEALNEILADGQDVF